MRWNIAVVSVALMWTCSLTASAAEERTIRVSGTGVSAVSPDTVVISAGADTYAPQAASALETNNRIIQSIRTSARRAGVVATDIRTAQFNIAPQYARDNSRTSTPQLSGYRVSHILEIHSNKIESGGELLDGIVAAGANVVRNVRFTVADTSAALQRARELAVEDAQAKAGVLAQAADVRLGEILSIEDGAGIPGSPRPQMALRAASAVPITPGEQKLSVTVTLIYSIQ